MRSRTILCFNNKAYEDHNDCTRKEANNFARRKLGERTDKRTGNIEGPYKRKDEIRGTLLAKKS